MWNTHSTYFLKFPKTVTRPSKSFKVAKTLRITYSLALQIQHLIYQCQLLFLLKNFKIRHLGSNLKICAYLLNLLMNWQRIWNCRYVVLWIPVVCLHSQTHQNIDIRIHSKKTNPFFFAQVPFLNRTLTVTLSCQRKNGVVHHYELTVSM